MAFVGKSGDVHIIERSSKAVQDVRAGLWRARPWQGEDRSFSNLAKLLPSPAMRSLRCADGCSPGSVAVTTADA